MEVLCPIIISAPLRRSGTTLVQRLLSSSTNTLIFGETCAAELQTMVDLYLMKRANLQSFEEERQRKLSDVLAGKVNDWIADLMPPTQDWLTEIAKGYFQPITFLQNYAKSQKRPLWGIKHPEWDPLSIRRVMELFPNTKVIYIERNPADCLQSAIAMGMTRSPADEDYFLKTGKYFQTQAHLHLTGTQTLFISYEKLVKEPETIISQLAEFSGAENIQSTVINFKINDDGSYVS